MRARRHDTRPAGTNSTGTKMSFTKELQLGGWCSDTEAIMGMNLEAYVGSRRDRLRPAAAWAVNGQLGPVG